MRLPTGTVTFLFTDIEGSTQLWERYPEAMRAALARHDALLRTAIESRHGCVFKTVGDAFYAAFATASEALTAALAAQLALQAEAWGEIGALRVRMGLHTGTAEERDNDYFGPTVNRVARLLSTGYGQQTLLSQTTSSLLTSLLPDQVSLRSLGQHRLKDLKEPESIWQLVHPALPSEFPALRSLNHIPNNLGQEVSSFIGREAEMADLNRMLAASRLLTLTGSGGVGKTRLALQVAADQTDRFAHGVWMVALEALADPELVPQAVAACLNVREEPGRPLLQTLQNHLKSKQLLFIFDNCEHLLDACARITDTLLRHCPEVHIMATSREALGLTGEAIYRVPSLGIPQSQPTLRRDQLLNFDSCRLFVERATLRRTDFAVTERNTTAIVQICRQLDGIPLALELAAARVKALPVDQIAERLDDRYKLLTDGSRVAIPRQQTLRALVDWSHDLLSAEEQMLFRRVSVFSGGWTLTSAEEVCPGEGIENRDILDLLARLVDKSLVIYEESHDYGRYRLLETLRQYGRERLTAAGETESVSRRHCDCYARLARTAWLGVEGADQGDWMRSLDAERDNLRAALDWCARECFQTATMTEEQRSLRAATWLELAHDLHRHWYTHGLLSEGRDWLERALAAPYAVDIRIRSNVLNAAGILAMAQGDENGAHHFHIESLELQRRLEDKSGIARSLNNLAIVADFQGDYPLMQRYMEESLSIYRELQNPLNLGFSLINLGVLMSKQGNYGIAESHYREALEILRKLEHTFGVSFAMFNLADVLLRQNHLAPAHNYLRDSALLQRELGSTTGLVVSLERFAALAVRQQRYELAVRWLGAAEEHRRATGYARAHSHIADFEQDRETACAALGQEAFAQYWSDGQQIGLEAAIDEALEL